MTVVFWILAPIMVVAALGVILARKAVHCALSLAVVMISLAMLYAAEGAPFLFAVQIIVYTGAILMLFLFVLMLVGVDTADSLVETIKGQRLVAAIIGVLFGAVMVLVVAQTAVGPVVGLDQANADGNVYGLASLLFHRYVFTFEATAALLITAVLGAMVLAHRERLVPRRTQKERVVERMERYAELGEHPGNLPTPGVFARHNAVDVPALLPDGQPVETSVSQVLRERGQVREGAFAHDVTLTLRKLADDDPGPERGVIEATPSTENVPAETVPPEPAPGEPAPTETDDEGEAR